jgi:hypothetical protein
MFILEILEQWREDQASPLPAVLRQEGKAIAAGPARFGKTTVAGAGGRRARGINLLWRRFSVMRTTESPAGRMNHSTSKKEAAV